MDGAMLVYSPSCSPHLVVDAKFTCVEWMSEQCARGRIWTVFPHTTSSLITHPCAPEDVQHLPEEDCSWHIHHQDATLPTQGGRPGAVSKKQGGTVVHAMTFKKMPWALGYWAPSPGCRTAKGRSGQGVMLDTAQNTPSHAPVIKEDCGHLSEGPRRGSRLCKQWDFTQSIYSLWNSFTCISQFIIPPSPILQIRKLKHSKMGNFS